MPDLEVEAGVLSAPMPIAPHEARSLLLVGRVSGTHVGASLHRAASALDLEVRLIDMSDAFEAQRWRQVLAWRLGGHRPVYLERFGKEVVAQLKRERTAVLVTTGAAPLTAGVLQAIGREAVFRINYSTDDPWNPKQHARWYLRALPHYDIVFSPRRANLKEFRRLGVREVRYLPFGYDPRLWIGPEPNGAEHERLACDVLFVGGADNDRAPVIRALARAGLDVALYGGYWERYRELRSAHRGHGSPETIRKATLAARVVLVLVRRANRDGHTMRSMEAGAIGACLLVEDTAEHRDIYGPEGEAVVYFSSNEEMVRKARRLLDAPDERLRLAKAVRAHIRGGGHTYSDRLVTMLEGIQVCSG